MNQWMFLFDGYGLDYNGSNPFPGQISTSAAATDSEESWPERGGRSDVF